MIFCGKRGNGSVISGDGKKVLVINTGGTIGMQKSDKGLTPDCEEFHRQLERIPELYAPDMPAWDMIDMEPLLDSSNIAVAEWNRMGETIAVHYEQYDGFVVLHGTDTMAYTASALSFMLENNQKPVILTGSQIPLFMIRTDARDNLITAIMLAADERIHEVCLYFGGKLLRGNRSMKYSADDLIAFVSPNYPPLAEAGIEIKLRKELLLPAGSPRLSGGGQSAQQNSDASSGGGQSAQQLSDVSSGGGQSAQRNSDTSSDGAVFSLCKLDNVPIGVLKVFPGIQFNLFDLIMTVTMKGIVVETFGAGNIPNISDALLPIIRKAAEHGTIIVVCSQCPHGTVSLGTYETSAKLKAAGAVSGYDITTEAAVVKLYYLFSKNLTHEEIREQMEQNLRGEISRS